MTLEVPLPSAAVVSTLAALLLMKGLNQYLPPAGAMAILPMLLPQESILLFPGQAILGISVLMGAALLFFRNKQASQAES